MSTADTKALIEEAVAGIKKEVPAFERLKLVVELERPLERGVPGDE